MSSVKRTGSPGPIFRAAIGRVSPLGQPPPTGVPLNEGWGARSGEPKWPFPFCRGFFVEHANPLWGETVIVTSKNDLQFNNLMLTFSWYFQEAVKYIFRTTLLWLCRCSPHLWNCAYIFFDDICAREHGCPSYMLLFGVWVSSFSLDVVGYVFAILNAVRTNKLLCSFLATFDVQIESSRKAYGFVGS